MAKSKKPDFVGIGPEKTGTTWLYYQLRRHPDVWMPPVKELRFLNEGDLIPSHSMHHVVLSSHWHYAEIRTQLKWAIRLAMSRGGMHARVRSRSWWVMRFCFGRRSFDWYASLFPADSLLCCGEISPLYYHIPESKIASLHAHNPDTKILVLIRNPVDRVWSKALMNLCVHQGRTFEDVSAAEFVRFFDSVFGMWTPYLHTIDLWQRYFSHVFVGYYDALAVSPGALLRDVCDFLEIARVSLESPSEQRINRGIGAPIPAELGAYLVNQYRAELEDLTKRSSSRFPEQWLEAYQTVQDNLSSR